MKALLLPLFMVASFSTLYAQPMVSGVWKVKDTNKQLTFKTDYTFEFKSPTKLLTGTYTLKSDSKISGDLIMSYTDGPNLSYLVTKLSDQEIVLHSKSKNQKLSLMRVIDNSSKKEVAQSSISTDKKQIEAGHEGSSGVSPLQSAKASKIGANNLIINPGYGVWSYLSDKPVYYDQGSLPITLNVEKGIGYNIAIGAKAGYRQFQIQESPIRAELFTLAPRAVFHYPILNNLDLYGGGAGVIRYGRVSNADVRGKLSFGLSPILGVSYYLTPWLGFNTEFATDASTHLTLGLSIKL